MIAFLAEGSVSFSGRRAELGLSKKASLLGSLAGRRPGRSPTASSGGSSRCGFLHENLLHIGFNMYVLYLLGMMLEPALGRLRFGVDLRRLAARRLAAAPCWSRPHAPTVGASGAVFGLMGAAAVELRARQIPVMQSGIGGLILINLVLSFTLPGISWGGHVGGLIGGALAALVLQLGDAGAAQSLGAGRLRG